MSEDTVTHYKCKCREKASQVSR